MKSQDEKLFKRAFLEIVGIKGMSLMILSSRDRVLLNDYLDWGYRCGHLKTLKYFSKKFDIPTSLLARIIQYERIREVKDERFNRGN